MMIKNEFGLNEFEFAFYSLLNVSYTIRPQFLQQKNKSAHLISNQ